METKYPDHRTYEALYAKYLDRGVDEIIGALPLLNGASVLDLCGGNGRLSRKLLEGGARRVVLVDREQAMVPDELILHEPKFRFRHGDVEEILAHLFIQTQETFDYAVCQQAINYWLDDESAERVASVLRHDGVFVFNTFNQKPHSVVPRVIEYGIMDHTDNFHSFVEVAWCIDDVVHHVQIRDGMTPHYTTFNWISPKKYQEILSPYFVVEEKRNGRSSLYVCTKK